MSISILEGLFVKFRWLFIAFVDFVHSKDMVKGLQLNDRLFLLSDDPALKCYIVFKSHRLDE
jgi:hypothetical protein